MNLTKPPSGPKPSEDELDEASAMAWLEQQKELGLDVSKVDSDQLAAAIGVSDLTEAIGLADSMDG